MTPARLAAGLLLFLALCGGAGAQSDPFCPAVAILPLTGSVSVFGPEQGEGDGAQEGAVAWRASLDSASISCQHERDSLPRRADIAFTGIAESDSGRIVTGMLPVFVSLVSRENILLHKRVEEQAIVLTAQMNRIAYGGGFRDVPIPLLDADARAGLRFVVGFQLDAAQLADNRRRAAEAAP